MTEVKRTTARSQNALILARSRSAKRMLGDKAYDSAELRG